ncbi:MAG: hypothetical protein QCI82_00080 [Candidatus Thermoplasmatota archaeon]|nr:hypothetical protein [Candidatus Thermoplasmatota archaeon]
MVSVPEITFASKVALTLIVLGAASYHDLRTRRVPDIFWIVLILAGIPILIAEMLHRGALERPASLLSLSMPAAAMVFIIWGYPEPGKVLRGERMDLVFTLVYLMLIAGAIASLVLGDRGISTMMVISLIFMAVYFSLYSFSIFGTRLIHGGADAKCLISLAALYPWYGPTLPISIGPFYRAFEINPFLEYASPFHLGVLINASLMTVIAMLIYIPLRNAFYGSFHPLRSWTSYTMDIEKTLNSHVWLVIDGVDGSKSKEDPTEELIRGLKRRGVEKVRVTPKIPFILSLTVGVAVQAVLGNLILALFLII